MVLHRLIINGKNTVKGNDSNFEVKMFIVIVIKHYLSTNCSMQGRSFICSNL